jgi:hypothetical protein
VTQEGIGAVDMARRDASDLQKVINRLASAIAG